MFVFDVVEGTFELSGIVIVAVVGDGGGDVLSYAPLLESADSDLCGRELLMWVVGYLRCLPLVIDEDFYVAVSAVYGPPGGCSAAFLVDDCKVVMSWVEG